MQDHLKVEVETIKKTQTEEILKIENLGKRTGTTDSRMTNRIEQMKERISGLNHTIEEIDIRVNKTLISKNS